MAGQLCACGCDNPAPLHRSTDRRYGAVKGQPTRYIKGHNRPFPAGNKLTYRPAAERFREKISVTDLFPLAPEYGPCWEWTGCHNSQGYGMFWDGKRKGTAHAFSYQLFKGPIPEGLEIDHLCRNRNCSQPKHLEAVSRSENNRRGLLGVLRAQTHCKNGHLYDPANTRLDGRGHRVCRACHRAQTDRFIKRNKAYYAAKANEYYWRNVDERREYAREYQRRRSLNG